jgi:hypothetical protein
MTAMRNDLQESALNRLTTWILAAALSVNLTAAAAAEIAPRPGLW